MEHWDTTDASHLYHEWCGSKLLVLKAFWILELHIRDCGPVSLLLVGLVFPFKFCHLVHEVFSENVLPHLGVNFNITCAAEGSAACI